jgi:hypothetical protein
MMISFVLFVFCLATVTRDQTARLHCLFDGGMMRQFVRSKQHLRHAGMITSAARLFR